MNIFLLFISGFIVDVIWSLYIKSLSDDKYFLAGLHFVGTGICGLFVIYEVSSTRDILTGLPYLIGLFFGTYFSKYLRVKQ